MRSQLQMWFTDLHELKWELKLPGNCRQLVSLVKTQKNIMKQTNKFTDRERSQKSQ